MIQNSEILSEAIILLLQDMRGRKNPASFKGSGYWREATSLLDRLGAPYRRYEHEPSTEAKAETTRETARESFRGMFADTYEALDDLVYRPRPADLVAERDKLADQLADAGNEILGLREERDKWRERVDYLEGECDRIQAYCDNLMAANIRLQNERNKIAIERIEGVV